MEKRKLWGMLILTVLSLILVSVVLTTATFAWFTFDPSTNVTPMTGKISEGDTILLISQYQNGPFARQCPLEPADFAQALRPVSTATLTKFYTATSQDREGYSVAFREITEGLQDWLIHGTVYLQCQGEACDVFFQRPALELGSDPQVLAAGRLGLSITNAGQTLTFLFRLDALGSTAGTVSRQTVRADQAVVGGLSGNTPLFTEDTAVSIANYLLDTPGASALCSMEAGDIATVEYWLYLEGCDPECYNPIQNRNITLQLGFAGEPRNVE